MYTLFVYRAGLNLPIGLTDTSCEVLATPVPCQPHLGAVEVHRGAIKLLKIIQPEILIRDDHQYPPTHGWIIPSQVSCRGKCDRSSCVFRYGDKKSGCTSRTHLCCYLSIYSEKPIQVLLLRSSLFEGGR